MIGNKKLKPSLLSPLYRFLYAFNFPFFLLSGVEGDVEKVFLFLHAKSQFSENYI
jgi:hypothetical protein